MLCLTVAKIATPANERQSTLTPININATEMYNALIKFEGSTYRSHSKVNSYYINQRHILLSKMYVREKTWERFH